MMDLLHVLFHHNGKKMKKYTEDKSAEAHEIKGKITSMISVSRTSIRKHTRQINSEFDKLDMKLNDVSRRIAIATGATRRGYKHNE